MPVLEEKERSASYKPVFVTEITDDLHFYVQDVETGECAPPPSPGTGPRPAAQRFLGSPQKSMRLLSHARPKGLRPEWARLSRWPWAGEVTSLV